MNQFISSRETAVARSAGMALHRQLFMVLRDEIARGVYADAGALPKEEDLCARFGVSRITVRRALADLAVLGLVERRHGRGTYVTGGPQQVRSMPTLGVLDSLRKVAVETEVRVLHTQRVAPFPDIAALLRLAAGEPALHVFRVRSSNGVPIMFTEAWVPGSVGKRITPAAMRKGALYEIMQDLGVQFGRVVQEISAQAASPDVAAHLQVELGAPLIKLVRLMHDRDARPVQHLTALLSPERSRILMDIPGDKINTLDAGRIVHDSPAGPGKDPLRTGTRTPSEGLKK
ncbi:GntR family transcriptional regulator [Ramlibacter henchirensis]|uniref:GntR family transcriptional regulator n=1 Tax=Ramlibacter henchirensis TaxID=204072 RepID=A0A4Z0BY10_9BURK|nr:GntR family transcriptional regulator [Ramlibacter henchirensis]TFZ02905.1 GntR family transcriptional regulator [Ramlibacter henchirensis]